MAKEMHEVLNRIRLVFSCRVNLSFNTIKQIDREMRSVYMSIYSHITVFIICLRTDEFSNKSM